MVLKTDLMCCNIVFVRLLFAAIARSIRLASTVRNSLRCMSPTCLQMYLIQISWWPLLVLARRSSLVQGKYAPSTKAVNVILEFALRRSRLTVCMNDARHSSTSEILRKSLERPKCLEAWLRLEEPSSFEIRWRYRTYN